MSDFPPDIDLTATLVLDKVLFSDNRYEDHATIANAILAERCRCLDLCRRVGSPEWSDDTNSGYELAAREIAEDIEKGR